MENARAASVLLEAALPPGADPGGGAGGRPRPAPGPGARLRPPGQGGPQREAVQQRSGEPEERAPRAQRHEQAPDREVREEAEEPGGPAEELRAGAAVLGRRGRDELLPAQARQAPELL